MTQERRASDAAGESWRKWQPLTQRPQNGGGVESTFVGYLSTPKATMSVSVPASKAVRLALHLIRVVVRHPRTSVTFDVSA